MVKLAKVAVFLCLYVPLPAVTPAQGVGDVGMPSRLGVFAEPPAAGGAIPQTTPIHYDTRQGDFELGFSFSYLRFRSSQFDTNTYGMTTDATYFVRNWLGVEGSVSSGFGVGSRSLLYGGGPRIVWASGQRVRPWAHVVAGGVHMFPQTAFSNNGFAVKLGGGVDFPLRSWLWARAEANYVRSQLYAAGQNNLFFAVGIVYRF